jgi:hypothetical protein
MAFSRSVLPDADAEVRGREVYLRQPAMGDYVAWAELRALSRQHLTVWEPLWTRDELARSAFRRRLRQYQREMREDQGYAFLIFREADAALLGGLTISNVRRGVAQSASVGYWLGLPHVRRGYMTDAVRCIVRVRHAGAASSGGSLPAAQYGFHPCARKIGLPARGYGPALSEDQRRLAGPRSVRASARRCEDVTGTPEA